MSHLPFEDLERLLLGLFPLESNVLLDHFGERGSYRAEVLDKPSIERGQAVKASHLAHSRWTGPVSDGLDLFLVYPESICTYNKA